MSDVRIMTRQRLIENDCMKRLGWSEEKVATTSGSEQKIALNAWYIQRHSSKEINELVKRSTEACNIQYVDVSSPKMTDISKAVCEHKTVYQTPLNVAVSHNTDVAHVIDCNHIQPSIHTTEHVPIPDQTTLSSPETDIHHHGGVVDILHRHENTNRIQPTEHYMRRIHGLSRRIIMCEEFCKLHDPSQCVNTSGDLEFTSIVHEMRCDIRVTSDMLARELCSLHTIINTIEAQIHRRVQLQSLYAELSAVDGIDSDLVVKDAVRARDLGTSIQLLMVHVSSLRVEIARFSDTSTDTIVRVTDVL
jgi:hypothetical protein